MYIQLTIFSWAFRGSFWDLWAITLIIKPVVLTILNNRGLFMILAFFIIALEICTNVHI